MQPVVLHPGFCHSIQANVANIYTISYRVKEIEKSSVLEIAEFLHYQAPPQVSYLCWFPRFSA